MHCSTSTTGCDEFIAGTFIVTLLVFLAEIMEKGSYHLFHKFSCRYFIFLCKVIFHRLFNSIKDQLTFNWNFPIIKIKHCHYIVYSLPRQPKIPMVYGKKYHTFKLVLKLSAKVLDKYTECVPSLHY